MKITTRNVQFRDPNGRMVSSAIIANGSLHDEVVDYLDSNPQAVEDAVVDATESWLAENITDPSQPAVDASLSVTGAAADAKKVGDELTDLNSDLYKCTQPDYVWDIGHTVNSQGVIGTSSVGAVSNEILVNGGEKITRFSPANDANENMLIIHICQYINGVFQSRTSLTTYNPLALSSNTTSIRVNFARQSSTGIAMTSEDIATYFDIAIDRKAMAIADFDAYKLTVTNPLLTTLKSLYITQAEAESVYGKILSNVPPHSYIWTGKSFWTDSPARMSSYFYCISLSSADTMASIGTQIAVSPDTGVIATRRIKSGSWTDWIVCGGTNHSNPVYYAFGDSLTWGAVWDTDQTTAYYQADLNDQMPTRIANAIGSTEFTNSGVSGARFVKQGDSDTSAIIGDIIKSTNFNNVDIITIGGGRNDSATALGDGNTATANDGTICGAIVDILEYLATNYPKLQVVMYGVTPQPLSQSTAPEYIYTRVFAGGWSLSTYYTEVSKVCARYGVPFIDWYGCTLILRWGVLSGGYNSGSQNWSHPLSGDIYKQMGNYLGGKVSSYYKG